MEVNGWRLFIHPLFHAQLEALTKRVARLASSDPDGYVSHPAAKMLATVNHYIRNAIPRDPNGPEFRQGNTLGPHNRHWFRAKFHGRFRLFYRFSTREKVIVYVWINDEDNLRKSGSKTDPYAVFRAMLESGKPPDSFAALFKEHAQVLAAESGLDGWVPPLFAAASGDPCAPEGFEGNLGVRLLHEDAGASADAGSDRTVDFSAGGGDTLADDPAYQ